MDEIKANRAGDKMCQQLCGPLNQLACAIFKMASGQNSYGADAFPEGQTKLNRILRKYVKKAQDSGTCRSETAATEIEALTKPE